MTLPLRLLLAILPIPALFAAVNFFWLMGHQSRSLLEQQHQRAQAMAVGLANNCAFALETLDPALIQTSLNGLFVERDIVGLEVVDPAGIVLAHQDPSLNGSLCPQRGADPTRRLQVEAPVTVSGEERARVRLELSLEGYHQALRQSRQRFLGLSLLLFSLTTALVMGLAYRITRPISILARTARAIASGDIQVETVQSLIREGRLYELAALRGAFRDLSARLAQGLRGEQTKLAYLREKIAELLRYQESVAQGQEDALELSAESIPELGFEELSTLAGALQRMAETLRQHRGQETEHRAQRESYSQAVQAAHARLQETDRYKNEFFSVVSHELRTPLTSVKAFSEILLHMTPEDVAERREFAGIIYSESDRLTRIINHLLDISRIESGKMRWHRETFELEPFVEQLIEGFEHPDLARRGITIRLAHSLPGWAAGRGLPAQRETVDMDRDKLREVLEAVLDNAVRLSPDRGRVRVKIRGNPSQMRVEVADQGPGVPPEHQELIFSKFQVVRLGDHRGGTGLSLALSRAVMEALGGSLSVESDGQKGSLFILTLPWRAPAAAPLEQVVVPPPLERPEQ